MNKTDNGKIYTSKDLFDEFAKEREKQGLFSMPASNNGEGRIARKDKSWSSVPGFFVNLFKKGKKDE